jgi:hypothetical protein
MPTNQHELFDLQQRIARLPPEDQMNLVERVLAGIRKEHFTDHEAIKQELAALEAWYSEKKRSTNSTEAKREAG